MGVLILMACSKPPSDLEGDWVGRSKNADPRQVYGIAWHINTHEGNNIGGVVSINHNGTIGNGLVSGNLYSPETLSFNIQIPKKGYPVPLDQCSTNFEGSAHVSAQAIEGGFKGTTCDGQPTGDIEFSLSRK